MNALKMIVVAMLAIPPAAPSSMAHTGEGRGPAIGMVDAVRDRPQDSLGTSRAIPNTSIPEKIAPALGRSPIERPSLGFGGTE